MTDHSVDANKIVAGMRDAVAHAKGDETAAAVHVVDRASVLLALADRVEAGEHTYALECEIGAAAEPERVASTPRRYLLSVDDAVAFLDRKKPGWFWRCGRTSLYTGWAHVSDKHPDHTQLGIDEFSARSMRMTPAAALTAAALRALAAEAGR